MGRAQGHTLGGGHGVTRGVTGVTVVFRWRAWPLRQVREEAKGELYRKWSRAHHKSVAAAGDEEDTGGAGGRLAARFERKNRFTSYKREGSPGAGGRGGGGRGGWGGRGGRGEPAGVRNAGLKSEEQVGRWRGGCRVHRDLCVPGRACCGQVWASGSCVGG